MIPSATMSDKPKIIFVAGPTASGKSKRAIELAKEIGGEVVSVDSRQVYKTLDIGTEKITAQEMEGVPHHLIDIREPEDLYSAGDFVKDASRLAKVIHSRDLVPIFAGGTHFYFDAFINGLPQETPPSPLLRAQFDTMSDIQLYEEIMERDPRRAAELDPKNRRRLVRALELISIYGKVPERIPNEQFDIEWHLLEPERDEMRQRIETRLTHAMERGLIDEVRRTRERVGDVRLNELGLEYRIVGEFLRNEREESALFPALRSELFDYARRQLAWLRKLKNGT